ncbi:MAG: HAD family hydrolase [Rhodoferax sp.]|uniref:HAD family hydrolase n=1 Tax=Rhodoferax sp. TaxID=50421 RepID=UPI0027205B22|nr:HAD family hydrolase [Rhodoferax sp.]MDO8447834.1 HAD family hydrolase [Rhodoferax sp.]
MNTNGHFRAVIFDVDGTLFDTLPSLAAAANSVLVQAGLREVSTSLLRTALNEGLRAMFRKSIALQTVPVEPGLATQLEIEYLEQYMQRWLPAAPLYAHLHDALSALKTPDLKLGICTNRDRASTEVLLAQARIEGVFDVIVGMGDAPHPKPAADPLLLVLEHMGISASEALFVGDSYMDATCAQQSQVRFAAHLGGYAGQPGDLLPNVFSFSDYDQLTNWVLGHQSATRDACHA